YYSSLAFFFFYMIPPHPTLTLFPYTTLFRSAVGHHVPSRGIDLDGLQQGVDADSKPFGVELGPFRDAADVDGIGLRGEFLKFLPAPGHRRLDEALDRKGPSVERGMGRRSRREHREIRDQVLTRREALVNR